MRHSRETTNVRVPHPTRPRDGRDPGRRALWGCALAVVLLPVAVPAQQLIGYVSTKDAEVAGASDVMDGHAVLSGAVAVTAKDHTAPITLGRGGTVRVCQTSILHLTESRAATLAAPLLLSLDRGAIEVEMDANASDALMTPDLRFTVRTAGPLDLRLRIARNGDTCVENRGPGAPTIAVSDPFGEAMYELYPNQHVLFEHGSVHEIVDHETTACGCPDSVAMSLADALLAPGSGTRTPAASAAAEHPFPTAVSEGLAPAPEVPQAPPGVVHAQISDALAYNAQSAGEPAAPAGAPPASVPPAQQPAAQPHGVFHAIGHFFHKMFTGG